jgi:hypothetical protein
MKRRHSTVRITLYALLLQPLLSILTSASYLTLAWQDITHAYPPGQRVAWLIGLVSSAAYLCAGSLMVRRIGQARVLYGAAAVGSIAVYLALLPWTVALSAVPACAWTLAVLYGSTGAKYFADSCASQRPAARDLLPAVCLAAAAVLLYRGMVAALTAGGADQVFGFSIPRITGVPIAALLLAAGILQSAKATRHWRVGITLGVTAAAIANTLLGLLPYSRFFAALPGGVGRAYQIPWTTAITVLFILAVVASHFFCRCRGPRAPRLTCPTIPEPMHSHSQLHNMAAAATRYWYPRISTLVVALLAAASATLAATPARADIENAERALSQNRPVEAAAELRNLAAAGNARAQADLGIMLMFGIGMPRDPAAALTSFQQSASSGSPEGQLGLASWTLFGGQADPREYPAAVATYRKYAEQGLPAAQSGLGVLYLRGVGVPKDLDQAARWFSLASDKDVAAAINLGSLYMSTAGFPRDSSRPQALQAGAGAGRSRRREQHRRRVRGRWPRHSDRL